MDEHDDNGGGSGGSSGAHSKDKETAKVAASDTTASFPSSPSAARAAASGSEWQKFVDDSSGATYYYNARSGESSWEEPAGFASASQDAKKPPQWRRVTDESSGRAYYYDAANGVTQWEAPEGVTVTDDSDDEDSGSDNGDGDGDTDLRDGDGGVARDGGEAAERSSGAGDAGDALKPEEDAPESNASGEDGAAEKQPSPERKSPEASETQSGAQQSAAVTWVKHLDRASGKPYYHNPASGVTQWEEPPAFVDAPVPTAAALEYQAHVNRSRTERLARVTQQVLDPTGSLGRLNAILSGINPGGAAAAASPGAACDGAEGDADAGAAKAPKAEWQQHVDPHTQRFYYHNAVTGETQWQKPDAPIVSGLADWVPPELGDPAQDAASRRTVSGVNYASTAKFNRVTGKFEPVGGDEYWERRGVAGDRAGRQMSHFFDMTALEQNRADAKVLREKLKRQNIDWKKLAAEKKAKKQKQRNEWLYQD